MKDPQKGYHASNEGNELYFSTENPVGAMKWAQFGLLPEVSNNDVRFEDHPSLDPTDLESGLTTPLVRKKKHYAGDLALARKKLVHHAYGDHGGLLDPNITKSNTKRAANSKKTDNDEFVSLSQLEDIVYGNDNSAQQLMDATRYIEQPKTENKDEGELNIKDLLDEKKSQKKNSKDESQKKTNSQKNSKDESQKKTLTRNKSLEKARLPNESRKKTHTRNKSLEKARLPNESQKKTHSRSRSLEKARLPDESQTNESQKKTHTINKSLQKAELPDESQNKTHTRSKNKEKAELPDEGDASMEIKKNESKY